jgi:DNA-binding CsgD family transcriptional regulator
MGLPSLIRPSGSGAAAANTLLGELREVARERERHATALWDAIDQLAAPNLFERLNSIAEALPLVVEADCATIRIAGSDRRLHLVAASGCSVAETRTRALQPLDLRIAARLADRQALARHGRSQGFRWVDLRWLGDTGAPIGSLLLASRTVRRPQSLQLQVFDQVATSLGRALNAIPGAAAQAQAFALQLARSVQQGAADASGSDVANLRPRERGILDLYADGLTTRQIAELLVISEHTVRTHVKTALRTLGLHNRRDAARLVRASQVGLFF